MLLQLKASAFRGTSWIDYQNCAMCKAYRAQTGISKVEENVSRLLERNDDGSVSKLFMHDEYSPEMFNDDILKAASMGYDDHIVREVYLEELNASEHLSQIYSILNDEQAAYCD